MDQRRCRSLVCGEVAFEDVEFKRKGGIVKVVVDGVDVNGWNSWLLYLLYT